MELTVATILVAFSGVFLICFMKGAFGGGFSINPRPGRNRTSCCSCPRS
jgi:hypothetical protein